VRKEHCSSGSCAMPMSVGTTGQLDGCQRSHLAVNVECPHLPAKCIDACAAARRQPSVRRDAAAMRENMRSLLGQATCLCAACRAPGRGHSPCRATPVLVPFCTRRPVLSISIGGGTCGRAESHSVGDDAKPSSEPGCVYRPVRTSGIARRCLRTLLVPAGVSQGDGQSMVMGFLLASRR
jgi:hypothetical protein